MSTLTSDIRATDWQSYASRVAWPTIVMGAAVVAGIVASVWLALSGQIPYWGATLSLTALTYWAFTVAHEAGHGNVHGDHTQWRWVGDTLGYLCCIWLVVPFPALRAVHNMHHAHSNNPAKDPDYWVNVAGPLKLALRTPLIVPHYFYQIFRGPLSTEPAIREIRVATALIVAAELMLILGLSAAGYATEVVMLYLLPALLASALLSLVFDWVPHFPYARQGRYKDTRVIIGKGLDWLTCGQSYHLVHHVYPRIPFYLYKRFFDQNRREFEDNGAIIEYAFDKQRGVFSDKAAWEPPVLPTNAWIDARLVSRTRETPESVALRLELPGRIEARPGQYMAVRGWIGGVPVDRCYSLVSVDGCRVEFGVKTVAGGRMSDWLNCAAERDIQLQVRGPAGEFFVPEGCHDKPKLIIAGGSGITPTLAIASDTLRNTSARVLMIYTSRNARSEIFRERLDALQKAYPHRFTLMRLYAQDGAQLTAQRFLDAMRGWHLDHGLNEADCEAYMCGPVGLMDMVQAALSATAIGAVHREAFVATVSGATVLAAGDEDGFSLRVEAHGQTHHLRIRPGANLLAGLLEGGVKASYGCGSGMCGTCMCQLASGAVDQKNVSGLTRDEAAAGKILPCSSVVTADSHIVL